MKRQPAFRERFRGHLALARISNAPTVLSNVLAGAALAGSVWDPKVVPVMAAMAMFYTAGMYLNDVCDYGRDRLERPERPLVQGIVSRRVALGIALLLFVLGSAVLLDVSRAAFIAGLVLTGTIVLYDAWHKDNPAAPLIMACNRGLVYVVAFVAVGEDQAGPLRWVVVMALAYVTGLTAIARFETRPGVLQRWPTVCLLFPVAYFAWQIPPGWSLALVLLFGAWIGWSIALVRQRQPARGITRLIAGISVFDALVLLMLLQNLAALVALALFGLTLLLQRFVKGT